MTTPQTPAPPAAPPAKPAPKSKAKAEQPMVTVEILSTVHHDGEEVAVGEELELSADQAKALVLAGAAGEPDDD